MASAAAVTPSSARAVAVAARPVQHGGDQRGERGERERGAQGQLDDRAAGPRARARRAATPRARGRNGRRRRPRRRRASPRPAPRRPCRRRRAGPRTRTLQSVRAGRCRSSAPISVSACGSMPKPFARIARAASVSAVVAAEPGAGAPFGQRVAHVARRAVAVDGDPPLLGALGDGAVEPRVANLPQRRRERAADEARDRSRAPPRARRTCATAPGLGSLAPACGIDARRHSGPSVTPRAFSAASACASASARSMRQRRARRRGTACPRSHRREAGDAQQRQRALERRDGAAGGRRRRAAATGASTWSRAPAAASAVAQRVGKLAPRRLRAGAARPRCERHQPRADHQRALQAARRARRPGTAESRTARDRTARASRIVGSRPKRRKISAQSIDGTQQLDQARVRGKAGIVRVRAAEDQRLHDDRDGDAERRGCP